MALTENQQSIIDNIVKEFDKINVATEKREGNLFNIDEIKNEVKALRKRKLEIRENDLKYFQIANEMAKSEYEALKIDMKAMNIPIEILNINLTNSFPHIQIGNRACSSTGLTIYYKGITKRDSLTSDTMYIGLCREVYLIPNESEKFNDLESLVKAITPRIKRLYGCFNK